MGYDHTLGIGGGAGGKYNLQRVFGTDFFGIEGLRGARLQHGQHFIEKQGGKSGLGMIP